MFRVEKSSESVVLVSPAGQRLRIRFVSSSIVRITFTQGRDFVDAPSRIVTAESTFTGFTLREEEPFLYLSTNAVEVRVDRASGALSYRDGSGNGLFREPDRGGKWLTGKPVYRNVFNRDAEVAFAQNIDGARAIAAPAESVFDRNAFEAKLEFVFSEDEALFGLGSHEEGYGNLRGHTRDLYQQNMKAVVPCFVSTRGYALLIDCSSLMVFHDDAEGSYLWADVVDELDYYVVCGASFDEITSGLHELTGKAPMLPKWALGYMQSKERYVNAQELIDVVSEYRRRRIPLDVIILDWKSWPNGAGWGQKSFDPLRFPDPTAMTVALHAMGARLMVSIWPIMTGGCADQRDLLAHELMLGNQSTYDAFNPEARKTYWEQARRGLFDHGVDAWWCDCTEPFESDWSGAVKPENHRRIEINTGQSKLYLDAGEINAYSLLHSQGIYEGQRQASSDKRVLNLTRSSYAGQHRYGTVTWSGDICGTWETLKRSIPEGLNFCATGEPYWTVDIGGFFVDYKPELWFWRGEYSEGCRGLTDMNAMEPDPNDRGCHDLGYWELYTRWVQYACFLPVFRSHGTDASREIWCFGDEGSPFYDAIAKFIRLRYSLLPYIYSLVANVTQHGTMMMRALALEFPSDVATHSITDQYLFGPALLVCPITTPMYYESSSRPIADAARQRAVYLPDGFAWHNFWTNEMYAGGQTIIAEAPLETMPLFVRAGSIVPMAKATQYVDEQPDLPGTIRVYGGHDAAFVLYEDAGDGYAYEHGEFANITMTWNESAHSLSIGARAGSFPSMVSERAYEVVLITDGTEIKQHVIYTGAEIHLNFGTAGE